MSKTPSENRKAKARIRAAQYRTKHPEKAKRAVTIWCDNNRTYISEKGKTYRTGLRDKVFAAYGGVCSCCKESEAHFLTAARKERGIGPDRKALPAGAPTYRWLIANLFPDSFHVLCWNCNKARFLNNGGCVHDHADVFSVSKEHARVVKEYGGQCVCCGESRIIFLTIDHINNDGAEHRKSIRQGPPLYRWLIANAFPKEAFQVLCYNCNCGRFHNKGACPHLTSPNAGDRNIP